LLVHSLYRHIQWCIHDPGSGVHTDDILSLRNFLWNFVTFWSSQGNLSSKKAGKLKKMQRDKMCHDLPKTWHDFTRQNALFRHWGKRVTMAKRDTIWWNPNSLSCYTRWKRGTIYLKRDTILGEFLCLFKLKTILKTRVTNWEEQSAIFRPKDG